MGSSGESSDAGNGRLVMTDDFLGSRQTPSELLHTPFFGCCTAALLLGSNACLSRVPPHLLSGSLFHGAYVTRFGCGLYHTRRVCYHSLCRLVLQLFSAHNDGSDSNSCKLAGDSGTSLSCPIVAGAAALVSKL